MSSPIGHILGIGHIIVGAGAIIAPFTIAQAFRIVPAASTTLVTRAFGTRDLIMGCGIQLYDRGTPENRVAVLACAVIHAIDVFNALLSYGQGYLPFEALVTVGGVDALLCGLSWLELQS